MADISDTLGLNKKADVLDFHSIGDTEMNSNVTGDNSKHIYNSIDNSKLIKEVKCTELQPSNHTTVEREICKDNLCTDSVSNTTDSLELNGNKELKSNNNSLSANECVATAENNLDELKESPASNMVMLIDAEVTDDALVISNANARPLSENITNKASSSLLLLSQYGSTESLEEITPASNLNYREDNHAILESDKDSDSDSSSTSSSSSVLISDSSDTESDDDNETPRLKPKVIKAKGELDLADLPLIEDLQISVPIEECTPIGKIFQIVDVLVVVQAFKNSSAYDVDTVLFLDGGKPLGKIFEVFGPVSEPHYCIRFNSQEHIKERNITLEQKVYSAPKTEFTKFVFLSQLMKMKGSDASWANDVETPENFQDYSDDEQESIAKKNRSRSGKATPRVDSDPEEPARKKHFAYEKKMNERNLQLSTISNRRFNNNQQPFSESPSCSSVWRNQSPRFREFIRHRFGSMPSFGPVTSNNFFPSGPRLSDSNFIHNFQTNCPKTGTSHSHHAFIPQWSPLSEPYGDPRSQSYPSPISSPYIQNECPRPNIQTSTHSWNVPPMRPPLQSMPPIGTHPSNLPLMSTPPPNMHPVNNRPPNLHSMRTPPPNMPPISTHPPNIPLMRTPPPNIRSMSTTSPFTSNLMWNPNMFYSNNLNPAANPMQRNIIRPPCLPPPPDWSLYPK